MVSLEHIIYLQQQAGRGKSVFYVIWSVFLPRIWMLICLLQPNWVFFSYLHKYLNARIPDATERFYSGISQPDFELNSLKHPGNSTENDRTFQLFSHCELSLTHSVTAEADFWPSPGWSGATIVSPWKQKMAFFLSGILTWSSHTDELSNR